jgi:BMFP domain-containing protein YqiC
MDNSRIIDDLTRVAGGAFSVFSALGKQIQNNLKDQMGDKFGPGFSSNDDVTRLQGVVSKLRIEQESLKSRITELESLLGKKPAAKTKAKPAAKKMATKPKQKVKKRA